MYIYTTHHSYPLPRYHPYLIEMRHSAVDEGVSAPGGRSAADGARRRGVGGREQAGLRLRSAQGVGGAAALARTAEAACTCVDTWNAIDIKDFI